MPELARGGKERGGSYHGVREVTRKTLAGSRLVRASLVVGDSSPDFPLRRWSQSTACTSNWEAKGVEENSYKGAHGRNKKDGRGSGARGCRPHRKSSTTAAETASSGVRFHRPGGTRGMGELGEKEAVSWASYSQGSEARKARNRYHLSRRRSLRRLRDLRTEEGERGRHRDVTANAVRR